MQIETYLFFQGQCEEALRFYERCLGGRVTSLSRYDAMPADGPPVPPDWKQKVLHATFECEGARFMASDAMPGQPHQGYSGFSVSLFVPGSVDKARAAFDALSQGGQVTMPFAPPFWGGHFGMLVDRFGVPWMVSSEH